MERINGEVDMEEVPPLAPAIDVEGAAPHPSRLGTGFTSAIRSSLASASRASTRLFSAARSALGQGHRNQALPIRCPRPGPSGPPSPLLPLQPEPTTSTANIGGDLLLQVPAMVLQRPYCQLHHHGNLQAARLRLHVAPAGHLGSNSLLLCHAIDIDIPTSGQIQKQPTPPVYLGETFLGLSYQAVVALLIFHFQGSSNSNNSSATKLPQPLLLVVAEVTVVVGFAASLIGVLLREVCREVAAVVERTGSVAAAVGFFLMVGMLFSTSISKWVGVLCGGASLVAFMLPIIKKKWD